MYQIGTKVIYGSEGVCTIEKIDHINISGINNDKMYYYLTPLYRGGRIYAPVDTPVKMREVITKEDALKLIDEIPLISPEVLNDMNVRMLNEHYQSIMKSYECEDLIRIIKTVFLKKENALKHGKKLGTTDEKFMSKAMDILYGELAIALDLDKDNVEDFIKDKLEVRN